MDSTRVVRRARSRSVDLMQPATYVRQVGERLDEMGVDVPAWLARSGLSPSQLDDAARQVPVSVFRRLVADALQTSGEPALGLLVGERLLVHTHGSVGAAALSGATLRETVEVFEQYFGLRTPLAVITHEVWGREVRIVIHERVGLGEVRQSVLEAVVLAVKNVIDFVALGLRPVRQVHFPFQKPDYAALARDVLRCTVRYRSAWAGMTVPVEIFEQPLKRADPAAFREAARLCERELGQLTERSAVASRVRSLLLGKGTSGFPSLQVSARLLHMTPRTLHRHLVREGTSFRQVLEDVRHTLALEHLQTGQLTIAQIACALGYTDLANFRRAFRRWEGEAPSASRARQHANREQPAAQ
jgi:AraC-like DNA-binding protein